MVHSHQDEQNSTLVIPESVYNLGNKDYTQIKLNTEIQFLVCQLNNSWLYRCVDVSTQNKNKQENNIKLGF